MLSCFCLIWFFTPQSTNFQLCWDRFSWVEPVLSKDKCVLLKDTTQWRQWGLNLQTCSVVKCISQLYNLRWHLSDILGVVWKRLFLFLILAHTELAKVKFPDISLTKIKLSRHFSLPPLPMYLFVCFVALHPKSTAMVMAGQSVHLTTLFFWASLKKQLTSTLCTYFRL